jgi:hypothetical protein
MGCVHFRVVLIWWARLPRLTLVGLANLGLYVGFKPPPPLPSPFSLSLLLGGLEKGERARDSLAWLGIPVALSSQGGCAVFGFVWESLFLDKKENLSRGSVLLGFVWEDRLVLALSRVGPPFLSGRTALFCFI